MEDNHHIDSLLRAVSALRESAHRVIHHRAYNEQASLIVGQYGRLHAKATDLLPEDPFLPTLAVEAAPTDPVALNQVSFAISQLGAYLKGLRDMPRMTEDI